MNRTLQSMWRLLAGSRKLFFMAIASTIVGTILAFVVPRVYQVAIDYGIRDEPLKVPAWAAEWIDRVGPQAYWARNLWIATLLVAVLACAGGFFQYLHGRWAALAAERIARRLRDRLYAHLQRLPATYHDKHETGDLVQRCTSDVETVRMFLAVQVTQIGHSIILLIVGLSFMLPISGWMALASTAVIPGVLAFAIIFFKRVTKTFKASDEAEGAMTAMLQENLTAIRVVRAFARQDHEERRFAEKNVEYRDRWRKLVNLLAIYWSSSDLLCLIQVGLVLAVGAHLLRTDPSFTVGDMVAFQIYVMMFLWPIRHMGRVLSEAGKATVSLGRIREILDEPEEHEPAEAVDPAGQGAGRIEFRDVRFAFPDQSEHALAGVSFAVEPGQTLAVIGPSGSGKSTIIKLLLRLYDFEQGEILLDGADIRSMERRDVRGRIGSVLQEPFLYSRSLRENLRFGRACAEECELDAAVEAAGLTESLRRFENGYDTLVGERGVTLSGGQRQRVAIARAILRDPPVLILDDALSAVDTRTEQMILRALRARGGRHTTIVIAHRISTLMHADRTIVLEHGRIVQAGTHAELIDADGMYRRLWQIQTSLEDDLRLDLNEPAEAQASPGE